MAKNNRISCHGLAFSKAVVDAKPVSSSLAVPKTVEIYLYFNR